MSQYLKLQNDIYYVSQWFGYSLSNLGKKISKNLSPIHTSKTQIDKQREVFDFMLNMMVFSSHYFEESNFYKSFEDYLEKREDVLSYEDYCKLTDSEKDNLQKEQEEKNYEMFKSYFDDSKIEQETTIYKLPYLLEGKQLGFRVIKSTWFVWENGILSSYPLITKQLSCILNEDGSFTHIEPDMLHQDVVLETPHIELTKEEKEEEEKEKEKKGRAALDFLYYKDRTIDNAVSLGIMTKLK